MSLEKLRKKYPEYNDIPDLELAEKFYKKHYSDIDEAEYYKKMFPGIIEKRPEEMEPLPEEATDYLEGRGILTSTTLPSIKPTVGEIAELRGVSINDPASSDARFGASLGYNQEQKVLGIKQTLSTAYGQDIDVRVGPSTGELEYYNPKIGKYALVD